jgi:hypothetical protein
MDNSQNTQEAILSKNTAQAPKINPLTFDEAALARVLEQRFSEPEVKPQKQIIEEDPESEAADAESQTEEADPTANQEENQDESPEDVLSEQKTEDQTDEEPSGYRKRIDKLTRQKREAIEKAGELERELNETKSKLEKSQTDRPVPVVNQADPFADVWDAKKLDDEWSKARDLRRWCEDNIDGCEIGDKEYSSSEIKQIKRRVEDALDVHIPSRARFLNNYKQIQPIAEQIYPFWKDRKSAQYTEAQAVLRQLPQLSALPEHQVLVGDFLEGRRLRMERETKGKTPVRVPAKAPNQPGKPTAAPVKKDAAKANLQFAKSRFEKTGGTSELAQVLKRML